MDNVDIYKKIIAVKCGAKVDNMLEFMRV